MGTQSAHEDSLKMIDLAVGETRRVFVAFSVCALSENCAHGFPDVRWNVGVDENATGVPAAALHPTKQRLTCTFPLLIRLILAKRLREPI
jgi:hypothetical protein